MRRNEYLASNRLLRQAAQQAIQQRRGCPDCRDGITFKVVHDGEQPDRWRETEGQVVNCPTCGRQVQSKILWGEYDKE